MINAAEMYFHWKYLLQNKMDIFWTVLSPNFLFSLSLFHPHFYEQSLL